MTIMAVDNHHSRLLQLVECLKAVFPEENIVDFTDPLLAVQYSFLNTVDVLFSDIPMNGMDGIMLTEGVRQKNNDVQVFLLAESEMYKEEAEEYEVSGYLLRPVTVETIKKWWYRFGKKN